MRVTLGNGVRSGLCRRRWELPAVRLGFCSAGAETAPCCFGFYELAYYKELFSGCFMEMYCSLEIAHKLLVATGTLRIVKLLFGAFSLVT